MKTKTNVAFCGYGYWGKNILRNLVNMDEVNIIAVCDTNERSLEEANKLVGQEAIYTTSYEQLLKMEKVDAVILATPPQTHSKLTLLALQSGKHVFVEKPMAIDYKEAIAMSNASLAYQKILMVGHTFLYHPVIRDLKNIIDSQELGTIHYIDFDMLNLGKYQQHNVLWDLAPHGIAIVLYLLDDPELIKVSANGISVIHENLIDVASLTLYFKNGSFANLRFSWLTPNKKRELTVVGSKKMAIFDDINPLEKLKVFDKGVYKEKAFTSWGESIVGYRHGNIVCPVTSSGEPLALELKHFIECIQTNQTPLSNGLASKKTIEIIEEANKQLENKCQ